MNRKIYIDLDETLIYSEYILSEEHYINEHFERWEWSCGSGCGWDWSTEEFVTYLRPFAKNFVSWMQNEYGLKNVFILTAATQDYAVAIVQHFGLNIPTEQIIAREHYQGMSASMEKRDPKDNPVLIDNEFPRERNAKKKIKFLGGTKNVKYHTIAPFQVEKNTKPEDQNHENIFTKIVDTVRNPDTGVIMFHSRYKSD